jgi:hypothetical protein
MHVHSRRDRKLYGHVGVASVHEWTTPCIYAALAREWPAVAGHSHETHGPPPAP